MHHTALSRIIFEETFIHVGNEQLKPKSYTILYVAEYVSAV
jgi:hypothetical protein